MQLLIKGYTFSLSAPFAEGHRMTAGEAQSFNDLRKENIQNNFRGYVNEQIARLGPGQLLPQAVLDGLQAQLTEYDTNYRFNEKSGRNRTGDLEAEAKAIARERAQHHCDSIDQIFTAQQMDELVDEMARLPAVKEEARSRVAARRSALAGGMESL